MKKINMICMSRSELEGMYREARHEQLLKVISEKGYSINELREDRNKMQEVADQVRLTYLKSKEEIEIFVVLFGHLSMYPEGSEVGFILKDTINARTVSINTLEQLKSSIKENSITDFGIMSDGDLRQFQLKQFRGKLSTCDLFKFIEKKIRHYGKDLGNTNLLILLQSEEGNMDDVDLEELSKNIHSIGIKSDIEVMLSYNENNTHDVICVIYPEVKVLRKKRPKKFSWKRGI